MSLVRLELRAVFWRWREVAAGAGVAVFGLWAALRAFGVLSWLGWIIAAAGFVLIASGVQRARFRRPTGGLPGPGVVQVTEGQIAYFGPLTGGVVALQSLTALALDGTGQPAHWLLTDDEGTTLAIPVSAAGAENLFDAFEQLPDLPTEALLRALEHGDRGVSVLWRRGATRLPFAPS